MSSAVSERKFNGCSFNEFLREEKLMATRCKGCGALHLPPRALCPKCHGEDMEWEQMKGEGKLATFTAVAVSATLMLEKGFGRDNPNCVGIVELDEGSLTVYLGGYSDYQATVAAKRLDRGPRTL